MFCAQIDGPERILVLRVTDRLGLGQVESSFSSGEQPTSQSRELLERRWWKEKEVWGRSVLERASIAPTPLFVSASAMLERSER